MTSGEPDRKEGQPGNTVAALSGLCPRCGDKTLFDGPVKFAEKCANCGLDYDRFNVGDGPAGFLTLIIGAVLVGLAMWLEIAVYPPFWVHVVLWVPLTALAVIGGLRIAKAMLLHAEYARGAGEAGRKE